MRKTLKEKFDSEWHNKWFTHWETLKYGIMDYSSNDIQSMYKLTYMALDGMEDVLTMPKDSS